MNVTIADRERQFFQHTPRGTATTMGFIDAGALVSVGTTILGVAAQERAAYLKKKEAEAQASLLERQLAAQQALAQQQADLERLKVEAAQQLYVIDANRAALQSPAASLFASTEAKVAGVVGLAILAYVATR